VIFTSDFTWDVSSARDRPYKQNEYKEHVKTRRTSKNFHLNCQLRKCGHPYNFLYEASLVLHLCKRTCPTGFTGKTFLLELKGMYSLAIYILGSSNMSCHLKFYRKRETRTSSSELTR